MRWLRFGSKWGTAWLALTLLASCQRHLPGPEECEHLSGQLLGIDDERLLAEPSIKHRFDELTIKCLTTPFDEQLVRCVEDTGQTAKCLLLFRDRRARLSDERSQDDMGGSVRRW
jgi:hypothetical protein